MGAEAVVGLDSWVGGGESCDPALLSIARTGFDIATTIERSRCVPEIPVMQQRLSTIGGGGKADQ